MKFCASCGKELDDAVVFCSGCGANVGIPSAIDTSSPPANDSTYIPEKPAARNEYYEAGGTQTNPNDAYYQAGTPQSYSGGPSYPRGGGRQ